MNSISVVVKSLLVGTPLESAAKRLRWLLGTKQRFSHPELWEVYLEDHRMPLVLQRLLSKDSCGVDVGSHVGSFLSMLTKFAPTGRHIAFEPSASRSVLLRKRFPNVDVISCAVADHTGSAMFQEDTTRPGFSRLQATAPGSGKELVNYEVAVKRLDEVLLDLSRIDLIKLDVEGGELAALRGAKETIAKFGPAIIFECGSEYGLKHLGLHRQDLYDFFVESLGYDVFNFADFLSDKGPMEFSEFRKCGLYPFRAFNFVALPRARR